MFWKNKTTLLSELNYNVLSPQNYEELVNIRLQQDQQNLSNYRNQEKLKLLETGYNYIEPTDSLSRFRKCKTPTRRTSLLNLIN